MKFQNLIYHHVFDRPGVRHLIMGKGCPTFFLHYARLGAAQFQYRGRTGQLIPEEHFQVYFITSNVQTFDFKSNSKCSLLSIGFPAEWLETLRSRFQLMAAFLDRARTGAFSVLFQYPQLLTAENKRLLNDVFLHTWSQDHLKHMIRLVLLPSLKSCHKVVGDKSKVASGENTVFAVAEWLLLNPHERASIHFLAQKFFINEFKLKADFKKQFGIPVITFQRKARVEKAKQLLAHSDTGIADIATATGFIHTTYFSGFFRRETGVSPSQYRRLMAAGQNVFSGSRE